MLRTLLALVVMSISSICLAVDAEDQAALNQCIATWGAKSPFTKGTPPAKVFSTGVKVFGIGNAAQDEDITDKPSLILVHPAVNVLGKTTIWLANPNGWYCFRSNVTVLGKIAIEAQCDAHIASARDEGTAVAAVDESNKGVSVFGVLRITRFGCKKSP
jgi:hypothetical protein